MADDKNPPPGAGATPQIQLQIDEVTAQGSYSNVVVINHTDAEFILDFAFLQPTMPAARVRSRVIASPRHAKRILAALQQNVARYEERFGEIPLVPGEGLVH